MASDPVSHASIEVASADPHKTAEGITTHFNNITLRQLGQLLWNLKISAWVVILGLVGLFISAGWWGRYGWDKYVERQGNAPPIRTKPKDALPIGSFFLPEEAPARFPWLSPVITSLETEAQDEVNKKVFGQAIPVAVLSTAFDHPTTTFTVRLFTPTGYKATGYIWRVRGEAPNEQYQPLRTYQLKIFGRSLMQFDVPESDAGDRLLCVVKIGATNVLPQNSVELRGLIRLAIVD